MGGGGAACDKPNSGKDILFAMIILFSFSFVTPKSRILLKHYKFSSVDFGLDLIRTTLYYPQLFSKRFVHNSIFSLKNNSEKTQYSKPGDRESLINKHNYG